MAERLAPQNGSFNVWTNLPTFDPTGGGDVVGRLNRDANLYVALGFLLPFLIPAFMKVARGDHRPDRRDPNQVTDLDRQPMGLCTVEPLDAGHCHRPRRVDDRGQTSPVHGPRHRGYARLRLILLALLTSLAELVHADPIRIATYNTELGRKGPGLLLRDIRRGDDQVNAVLQVLVQADADILALQSIDWDYRGQTLGALVDALAAKA